MEAAKMDNVEGFQRFNSSKAVEVFTVEKLPGIRVQAANDSSEFDWSNMLRVGYGYKRLALEFEERDRKAVADLFRKMADSLDGQTTCKVEFKSESDEREQIESEIIHTLIKLRKLSVEDAREYFGFPNKEVQ